MQDTISGLKIMAMRVLMLHFSPLFPMIWKGLSFSIIGIVFFNAILFLSSFYILIGYSKHPHGNDFIFKYSKFYFFFISHIPNQSFFASSALSSLDLKIEKKHLIAAGLLLCALSRLLLQFLFRR